MIRRTIFWCLAAFVGVLAAQGVFAAEETPGRGEDGAALKANGPTIVLDYSVGAKMNPTEDFMYFVPLISPTLVRREISEDNTQTGTMISCERKLGRKSFSCECVFKMVGGGTQTYMFDPSAMVEHNLKEHTLGDPLTKILDYIKFDGEGEGKMVIEGQIEDGRYIVTKSAVHFANGKKYKSPVEIGLYNMKYTDGKYDYKDRYGMMIARVDVLTFTRSNGTPEMGIKIAHPRPAGTDPGIGSGIKGWFANFLIPDLEVDKLGNDTMLDFGHAMYEGEKVFTFPKALKLQTEEATAQESEAISEGGTG